MMFKISVYHIYESYVKHKRKLGQMAKLKQTTVKDQIHSIDKIKFQKLTKPVINECSTDYCPYIVLDIRF